MVSTQSQFVAEPSVSERALTERLIQVVCDVLRLELTSRDFSNDTNLYELGLESLRVVELLSTIEKKFDVVVDVEDLSAELFARFENLDNFVRRKIHEAR